jgi:phosphoribosylamine--glycine ligase
MRLLVIDDQPEIDFLWRCKNAGHDVKWYVRRNPKKELVGKGMVDRVPEYRPWMQWADLIVLSPNTKYVKEIDTFRQLNPRKPIVGATVASAAWELDRKTGMDVFKKAGIPIPEFKEFKDCKAAIKYVEREGRGFVSKPCWAEEDKNMTYLGKTPEALISMLQRWDKECRMKGDFILQELVKGVEMAVGGWFGPGGFNLGWCENWEEKKLYVGGLGPSTGEMGTTVRYTKKSKLADKVLKPLVSAIEKTGHVGYVDVNCIVGDDGTPWPLEFTMRDGCPTYNIQDALHTGDPIEWYLDLAEGRDARCVVYDKVAVGVVMAQGDFPHSKLPEKDVIGFPIYGLDEVDGAHLCEAMIGEAPSDVDGKIVNIPCVLTAGDYILVAVGTGDTIREARKRAYKDVLEKIKMPNSAFWRVDIGKRLQTELPKLQAQGYAMGLKY